MRYIGKILLTDPIDMQKVAEILGLEDVAIFQTDDVVGTMKWRGGNILVLVHLSWGDKNKAEKIRIYAHHLEDTEENNMWILIKERLKSIIKIDDNK